ncbi:MULTISPECIES: YdcF family protein [Sphingobacterium]|uniref:YdcF family protein n=1 Tax=Sphingobacterium litopenaei TaxID=2763500 RepID=A0ABR7YEN9_9SPHI|nr:MULTISPECIES: YdcF family protein [Sphingobacterium]MBD1429736.1 YdcF family protein [Sphingobacterium litopenaei]NGM74200.1 YdcF family protein [Sphingobacterium sp. SGL-16]
MASSPKTIMLVLGSDNPEILATRIQIANRLYKVQNIDKIIVSGGCGAHKSSICEASVMYNGLVQLGIEPSKIYKEENAKTTVQNYVFSRVLKDEYGSNIIQKGDTVFVVSNHWHAVSVAARLRKHDAVHAKFFIEGDLSPKENDKLDYVSIFNGEIDNEKFIRNALWLTPQVSWENNDNTYYLMDSTIYEVNGGNLINIIQRNHVFNDPKISDQTGTWSFIDNGNTWFIKTSNKIYVVNKRNMKVKEILSWDNFIDNVPNDWRINGFNAGIILNDKLVLFSNNAVLIAEKRNNKFVFKRQAEAKQLIPNWPFSWGKSNVAGVNYQNNSQEINLYRNREYLKLDKQLNIIQEPLKLNVKWVNNP